MNMRTPSRGACASAGILLTLAISQVAAAGVVIDCPQPVDGTAILLRDEATYTLALQAQWKKARSPTAPNGQINQVNVAAPAFAGIAIGATPAQAVAITITLDTSMPGVDVGDVFSFTITAAGAEIGGGSPGVKSCSFTIRIIPASKVQFTAWPLALSVPQGAPGSGTIKAAALKAGGVVDPTNPVTIQVVEFPSFMNTSNFSGLNPADPGSYISLPGSPATLGMFWTGVPPFPKGTWTVKFKATDSHGQSAYATTFIRIT